MKYGHINTYLRTSLFGVNFHRIRFAINEKKISVVLRFSWLSNRKFDSKYAYTGKSKLWFAFKHSI